MKTYTYYVVTTLLLIITDIQADLISTRGEIRFDINNDMSNEANLNSNGLYIQGNLDVGNIISSSNINLGGSISYSSKIVSDNITLDHYNIYFADTSLNNFDITLPSAMSCNGRVYQIKKIGTSGNLTVKGDGDDIDGINQFTFINRDIYLPSISLISSGSNTWHIIQLNGEVEYEFEDNILHKWSMDGTGSDNIALNNGESSDQGVLTNFTHSDNSIVGVENLSLSFDGVDDYINFGNIGSLGLNYSISAWVKSINTEGTKMIASFRNSTNANAIQLQIHMLNDDLIYIVRDGGGDTSQLTYSNSIIENTWFHVTAVRNGSEYSLFLNGIKVVSNTNADVNEVSTADTFLLGDFITPSGLGMQNLEGQMDEVVIYSKSLTADEVKLIYDSHK